MAKVVSKKTKKSTKSKSKLATSKPKTNSLPPMGMVNIPVHQDEETHHAHAKQIAAFSPLKSRLRKFKHWLAVPKNRYSLSGTLLAVFLLVFAVQPIRYGILNSIGVRASLTVTVLDQDSDQPLKNVLVRVDDTEKTTDRNGFVTLKGLKLGRSQMFVEKLAYATTRQNINIGTGVNALNNVSLEPVGIQFSLKITDWTLNEPIANAEVTFGENSVSSDKEGVALLTIPPTKLHEIIVKITYEDYRTEEVSLSPELTTSTDVKLVLDRPNLFVSKRSGKYDLRKVDLDGKNDTLVLAGTGKESKELTLLNDPVDGSSYFVSSRDGTRNDDGDILYGLYKVNTRDGSYDKIDESESIRVYGISSSRLIYVKVASGSDGTNPQRQRLISYDPISDAKAEIYSTNYFNSILLTENSVYYATSDYYKEERTPYMYQVNPADNSKRVVHAGEVWTLFRDSFDSIIFDARQDWYSVGIGQNHKAEHISGRPADLSSKLFVLSPDGSQAVWVDSRDGKDHLILIDTTTLEETSLYIANGLKYPIVWQDDSHLVVRAVTETSTTDYLVDTSGNASKLVNVSDVGSYDRWYYYY